MAESSNPQIIFFGFVALFWLPSFIEGDKGLHCQVGSYAFETGQPIKNAETPLEPTWKPGQPWKDQFEWTDPAKDLEQLCSVIRLKNVERKWDVYLAMPSPLPMAGSKKDRRSNRFCHEFQHSDDTSQKFTLDLIKNTTKKEIRTKFSGWNRKKFADYVEKKKNNDECEEYVCDMNQCNEIAIDAKECGDDDASNILNGFLSRYANEFPTDSMYDEDSNAESIRRKCEGNHEIKESDENWFECWTQDDSGDEPGFDYVVEDEEA